MKGVLLLCRASRVQMQLCWGIFPLVHVLATPLAMWALDVKGLRFGVSTLCLHTNLRLPFPFAAAPATKPIMFCVMCPVKRTRCLRRKERLYSFEGLYRRGGL